MIRGKTQMEEVDVDECSSSTASLTPPLSLEPFTSLASPTSSPQEIPYSAGSCRLRPKDHLHLTVNTRLANGSAHLAVISPATPTLSLSPHLHFSARHTPTTTPLPRRALDFSPRRPSPRRFLPRITALLAGLLIASFMATLSVSMFLLKRSNDDDYYYYFSLASIDTYFQQESSDPPSSQQKLQLRQQLHRLHQPQPQQQQQLLLDEQRSKQATLNFNNRFTKLKHDKYQNPVVKHQMDADPGMHANIEPEQPLPHVLDAQSSIENPPLESISTLPRIVFLNRTDPPRENWHRTLEDDPMMHAPLGFEAALQDRSKPDTSEGNCVPMQEWHTKSFPNCNLLHEFDLHAAGTNVAKHHPRQAVSFEDQLQILGQGWFRHTWRLDVGATGDAVVLKTLRLEREFYDEFYDLHRRDALAMERLTHSSFVMNIYGYCGQSALNELADFGYGGVTSLEKFDRALRGNERPETTLLKLQVASSIAVGLAHVHEIDGPGERASMVHYDLNPRNIAIVKGGKPKLNDFNIAEFLRWDPITKETCGFPSRLHEPWWRAPEEVTIGNATQTLLDEKVDVWALGNLLFHVLTTHSPRGKMFKERIDGVRQAVLRGDPPLLPDSYRNSTDPIVKAFRDAMDLCFHKDPRDRGTAREVAEVLISTLMDSKAKRQLKMKHHN